MENKSITDKIAELESKKSVHISMSVGAHAQFRKKLFDFGLSMQEVLELFANLAGENDSRAIDIIKEAKQLKRSRAIKKFTSSEVDNLYDAISENDPFEK